MKKTLFIVLILIFTLFSFSEHINFDTAKIIAKNWTNILNTYFKDNVKLGTGKVINHNGIVVAYVFNFLPKGFLLISSEDYLPPIKMYSLRNNFNKEGKELEKTVIENLYELIYKVNTGRINPDKYFLPKNKRHFKYLTELNNNIIIMDNKERVYDVSPLLKTKWGQSSPFNDKCPTVNGSDTPSGCVATAFSQIMKYFNYPENGQGSKSYVTDTHKISLSANFNHKYDWENMLTDYSNDKGSATEREAVAQLMYDVGVAFEMDYAPGGSGAYPDLALEAMPKYFKYSSSIKGKSRYYVTDDNVWFNIAKQQIDKTLPVAFSIYGTSGGHEVVIDGYRIANGSTMFHINFGWEGSSDSYYSLNNVGTGFQNNQYQYFVYDIYPPNYFAILPPTNVKATSHTNRSIFLVQYVLRVSWDLSESGTDVVNKYKIYLKDNDGNTTLIGEVANNVTEFEYRRNTQFTNCNIAVTAINNKGQESTKTYTNITLD